MKYIVTIAVLALVGVGLWYTFMQADPERVTVDEEDEQELVDDEVDGSVDEEDEDEDVGLPAREVMGSSVEGRDIALYRFGSGQRELLLVGGIHGGYSWNTALLAYEIIDRLEDGRMTVPDDVVVSVVPVLNPDGLYTVTGVEGRFEASDVSGNTQPGRFNARGVDLNRNFDCAWQASAVWRGVEVDPGSSSFSEPESRALREYVERAEPAAVIAYYSAAGGVYSSSCDGPVLSRTGELMNTYADASNYPAEGAFDAYEITGDAVDWVASLGIAGISVLLSDHDATEEAMNVRGIEAVLSSLSDE